MAIINNKAASVNPGSTRARASLIIAVFLSIASACSLPRQGVDAAHEAREAPDFFAYAEGSNDARSIKIAVSRVDGEVRGSGRLLSNGARVFLSVREATLCTDPSFGQNAILQTDDEQPLGIWTPACVEVEVRVWRFPFPRKTLLLSECEPANTAICDLGGGDTDPHGSCIDFDRDTVKWQDEFVVPGETAVFVPAFQKSCRKVDQRL